MPDLLCILRGTTLGKFPQELVRSQAQRRPGQFALQRAAERPADKLSRSAVSRDPENPGAYLIGRKSKVPIADQDCGKIAE